MSSLEQLSLLAVGLAEWPAGSETVDVRVAGTARETLAIMRLANVDLLLAGTRIPDMSIWAMIRRVRASRPGQRWAMVGADVTVTDEIQARSLGVVAMFDATP